MLQTPDYIERVIYGMCLDIVLACMRYFSIVSYMFRRRDLAPHLKSIMGPWWFSQFDSVSEVSQAAKSSLQVGTSFLKFLKICFSTLCLDATLPIIGSPMVLLDY